MTMPQPDLTELMFHIGKTSPDLREALWHDLSSLSVRAKAYRWSGYFFTARLTSEEVEEFERKYPSVATSVNEIIAGQEYPLL